MKYGRTILPSILASRDTIKLDIPRELIEFAHDRCRYLMRDLIEGKPLTSVLAKAYMQGFIDRHEAKP